MACRQTEALGAGAERPEDRLSKLFRVHREQPVFRAFAEDKRILEAEWRPESLVIAQQVKAHAEARGITAGQFAVNWVLNSTGETA